MPSHARGENLDWLEKEKMAESFYDWKKLQNQVKKPETLHKKSTEKIRKFNSVVTAYVTNACRLHFQLRHKIQQGWIKWTCTIQQKGWCHFRKYKVSMHGALVQQNWPWIHLRCSCWRDNLLVKMSNTFQI